MNPTVKPPIKTEYCSHPNSVIAIWVTAKQRVANFRPIARALHSAGYDVRVYFSKILDVTSQDLVGDASIPCYRIGRSKVGELKNIAVFIASEQYISLAPKSALRVAIHHSLPDNNLQRDYAKIISRKVFELSQVDYYFISVVQSEKNWSIERYARILDRQLPKSLLDGRPDVFCIVPFGYPKIDKLIDESSQKYKLDTITYAPTQSTLAFSSVIADGEAILNSLLEQFPEYRIAFRPYPGADLERLKSIINTFNDHPRFFLDDSVTGIELNRRTAVMITDRSSIAMSFGLGLARPVVFYSAGGLSGQPKGGAQFVRPVGVRVTQISDIALQVELQLKNRDRIRQRIIEERENYIYNIGNSIDYLIDTMPDIIAGRDRPEWLVIPRRPFPGRTKNAYQVQAQNYIKKIRKNVPNTSVQELDKLIAEFDKGPHFGTTVQPRLYVWTLQRMRGLRHYLSRPKHRK